MSSFGLPLIALFLSTPSARRATAVCDLRVVHLAISIHALREEGDLVELAHQGARRLISIHALREEGDRQAGRLRRGVHDFYPRPPRGGRRTVPSPTPATKTFLSTPSARRATRGHRSS